MSKFGGLALFDIRTASRTMYSHDIHSVKTRYYEEDPNYLGVLTSFGSLELYDIRNFKWPIMIYNSEYTEHEKQAELVAAKEKVQREEAT